MKQIFTLFLAIFAISLLHAQQISPAPATSVVNKTTTVTPDANSIAVADNMLLLKETEFDFGKIPQGKPVTHTFEVTNNSKVAFKINNVAASCGCTTPEWEKDKLLAPGEKTKITVGFNAAAEGPFTKFISIAYNDTQSKQITIKGDVWKTPGSSAPENKGLNDLKN